MPPTTAQIDRQRQEAEELLFSGPQTLGFAKGLFFGHFNAPLILPYPALDTAAAERTAQAVADVRRFCDEHIDATRIDRDALIPDSVIGGLGKLGVLGMTAPTEFGGSGFSQLAFAKVMEVIGGHCESTAVFVNAHQSIGIRALLLFGSEEQKQRWLGPLVRGEKLAAFALTEPNAGSDASNVQTTAVPTADGRGYVLNGEKRWITNGGIADVLTVIARTPGAGAGKKREISAFLVTPDLPGFQVLEKRMEKISIRGTATARLAFRDMVVPKENLLGELGKGLRIGLTVLDFGRVAFGATCTGAAKTMLRLAVAHARQRVQFDQPIGEFESVRKKIAQMAAAAFAMESMTAQCGALIDRGGHDYMLETAILKVWSTDRLWQIVFDTMQIYGGKGFFTDEPLERWMRDARLNTIGEGSNDVLRPFIAMVGIKPVADLFLNVKNALSHPLRQTGKLLRFFGSQLHTRLAPPDVPVQSSSLRGPARELARQIRAFGLAVQNALMKHREQILFRQMVQERLADAACELYASSCVLSRLERLLSGNGRGAEIERDTQIGKFFLAESMRRCRHSLAALADNDDAETLATAQAILE